MSGHFRHNHITSIPDGNNIDRKADDVPLHLRPVHAGPTFHHLGLKNGRLVVNGHKEAD